MELESVILAALGANNALVKDSISCTLSILNFNRTVRMEYAPLKHIIEVKRCVGCRSRPKIISFCLFGKKRMYLDGAVANAKLAPFLYPVRTSYIFSLFV